MTEIVVADIGGTHARFALARVGRGGVSRICNIVILKTADYPGLEGAWTAFAEIVGHALPTAAALAVAGPAGIARLKLTNTNWTIVRSDLKPRLGIEPCLILNDFGAVAHAVATLPSDQFEHLCGPNRDLNADDVISVIGPGTGFGVAHIVRNSRSYHVVESEGGHAAFAPLDPFEDALVKRLRSRHGRISAERLLSGSGLGEIHACLLAHDGAPAGIDERQLWEHAMEGGDPSARAALNRFCAMLGAVAGDIALVQGATAVVIGGGLGRRLAGHLSTSAFSARFRDKGRMSGKMHEIPVKIVTYDEPGLYGAAAAFASAAFSGELT